MTKTSCDGGSAASASACASAAAVAVAVAEICIYLQVKFAFFSLLHSLLIYLLFPRFLALTHPQTHTHTPLQALTMQLKNLLPAFRLILCHFLLSIVASVAICNTVLSRRAVMPLYSPTPPSPSPPLAGYLPLSAQHACIFHAALGQRALLLLPLCCCCCCWRNILRRCMHQHVALCWL